MSFRFGDSFAVNDAGVKYTTPLSTFLQSGVIDGPQPSTKGYYMIQTAGGEANFTKVLDTQAFWIIGFNFQFRNNATAQIWQASQFLRIEDSTGSIVSLAVTSAGKITVQKGGGHNADGSPLDTTSQVFAVGTWYHAELEVSLTAGYKLRINGTVVLSRPFAAWIRPAADRITWRWQNGGGTGLAIANLYYLDGQTAGAHTSFATVANSANQVSAIRYDPAAEVQSNWTPNTGAPIAAVTGTLDGDATYLIAGAAGAIEFFSVSRTACFGLVLGVALNLTARPIFGITGQQLDAIVRERVTIAQLARHAVVFLGPNPNPFNVPLSGYATYQALSELSAETGRAWTDAQISGASWGARMGPQIPNIRLTQVYLEKFTSLDTTRPYDCGQSSYSYGR